MLADDCPDPTAALARAVAAAVLRDADRAEGAAIFEAAAAIAGNDRAAARFGQAISAAIVGELRNGGPTGLSEAAQKWRQITRTDAAGLGINPTI